MTSEDIFLIRNHIEIHARKEPQAVKITKTLWKAVQELEHTRWHYPSKGEMPDKDWSKHPLNVSKECFVFTKRGIGTIARWDEDYRTWFEKMPHLPVTEVIAWKYFEPPKEEKENE